MARKLPHRNFKNKAFTPLAVGLGRTALSQNDLLISLSSLLGPILHIPNNLITNLIWHSIKSDRDQIGLIRHLAESPAIGITIPAKIRAELVWLCDRAENLLDVRNDLLHTPFVKGGAKPTSLHLGTHQRGLKLAGKDATAECAWFYKRTTMLRDYAESLEMALTRAGQTLPKRPILPDRPNYKNQHRPAGK